MIYKIVIKNIIYKYKSQNTILSLLQLYSQPLIGLYSGPSRGGGGGGLTAPRPLQTPRGLSLSLFQIH